MNDLPRTCQQYPAPCRARRFLLGEAGAASVDFVVLTAGIIGLALAAAIIFTSLSTNVMRGVSDRISTQELDHGQRVGGDAPSQGQDGQDEQEPDAGAEAEVPNGDAQGSQPNNWDCPAAGRGNAPGDCGAAARAANPGRALGPGQR